VSLYASHAEVRSRMIGELHGWWLAHRNGDIPDRACLDPVDFTHLLPSILLSEVVHQPFRIRFRLVGTKVVAAIGLDTTGQFLDELISPEGEPWLEHYRLSYRARVPVFGTTSLISTIGARSPYEFGIFPLRRGKASIDQFVAIEDYFGFSTSPDELVAWRHRGAKQGLSGASDDMGERS
jgi:hypothetical protein